MDWQELESERTEDLIDFVKSKDDPNYKDLSDAAFIVLTFRFRVDLLEKCKVVARKWGREDDAPELANRVFARFYKYPKYDHSKCKSGDYDTCLKRYLYGITNKEIVNFVNTELSPYDGSEKVITSLVDANIEHEPEKLKLLKQYEARLDEIFSKLTPKHKIIFLTYKHYEVAGHKMPRHLLEAMRTMLNLTQNTVRVYKNEAYEIVEKELSNNE